MTTTPATPGWSRRHLLRSGATALGSAGVGWTLGAALAPGASTGATPAPSPSGSGSGSGLGVPIGNEIVPFHGAHQAGVATPPAAYLSLLGLDLKKGRGRDDLARMMRLLSDDASRLSTGAGALADTEAELGAKPASLTTTFGFGPRVMAMTSATGGQVEPLPAFGTDALEEAWGQTDVVIQICADDPMTLAHARRMLLKDSAAFTTLRWCQDGFRRARGIESDGTTPRNVMGQVDGTVNPAETDTDFSELIWSDAADFAGGTFMVVRRIRALMTTWDEVDRPSREAAVGRRIDNGAPLTGTNEFDDPDFKAVNAAGLPIIDAASHIARARPMTTKERFLRRPYNYTVTDPSIDIGEDAGLVFIAYAASIPEQFVPVQRRLAETDLLNEWTVAIGSAVYAVPPGAADGEYVGQRIFG